MSILNIKPNDSEKSLGVADEKNKQWQREFLMERLRSHHSQHKGFPELSKAIRMAMLEKRYALDAVEKSNLQKCLDSMQHCIKVTTRQGLIERLESLSRQLGLKFMEDSSGLFISSDMFFLEIILDSNGTLSDVKVHHECKIEQQSCSELVNCLINGDFTDFTNQLEGLSSIYQLNAEPKVKSKAFVALQAMETDLYNLFKWQNYNKDISTLLIESPVGVVQKRRGGHPMKLTYFISPYDLLSLESKTMLTLSMELLKSKEIGLSATVNLEASSANKLQILPSVTFSKDTNYPIYSPLSQTNSTLLPATFVLRLNKPLPVCTSLLAIFGQPSEFRDSSYILNLTVQAASKGQIQNAAKGLFVSLPDQNHCYFFTENKTMRGSIITNVPFTEPSQVPKMLSALKQQALFYTLLSSCIRIDGKICSLETTTMLEVNAISLYKISVSLQHANEDSMVAVEFNLNNISDINVKIYSLSVTNNYENYNQKLTKIAQATLSIPVTIRFLLKLWEKEQMQPFLQRPSTENGNLSSGSKNDPNGSSNGSVGRSSDFRDSKTKYERNNGTGNGNNINEDNSFSFNNSRQQFFHSAGVALTNSSDLSFQDTNLSSNSTSTANNFIGHQFGLKSESKPDFALSTVQHEDFCKSPKSEIQINSIINNLEISDLNSLGNKKHLQTKINTTSNSNVTATSSSLSSLIIERVNNAKVTKNLDIINNSEMWLKKAPENKNTVSITPVISNNVEITGGLTTNANGVKINEDKRSEIEIIPIPNNILTSISIMPIDSSSSFKSSVKKRNDEKGSNLHKSEKKRRKRESSSSSPSSGQDKMDLKIIELSESLSFPVNKQQQQQQQQVLNASKKQTLSSANKKLTHKNSSFYQQNAFSLINNNSSNNNKLIGLTNSKQSVNSSSSGGKPSLITLKSAAAAATISSNSMLLVKNHQKKPLLKDTNNFDINTKTFTDEIESSNQANSFEKYASSFPSAHINLCSLPNELFQDEIDSIKGVNDIAKLSKAFSSNTPTDKQFLEYDLSEDNLLFGNSDSTNLFQSKFRKHGSLSAVIKKLKQAQSCGSENIVLERINQQQIDDLSQPKQNKECSNLNSQYMIKPSLDGMKLTINKTRNVDTTKREKQTTQLLAKSNISTTTSGFQSQSPNKKHTGLKPGVFSGPASKAKVSGPTNFSRLPEKPKHVLTKNDTKNKTNFYKSSSSECLPLVQDSCNFSSTSGKALSKSLSSNSLNTSSSSNAFRKDKNFVKMKIGTQTTTINEKYINNFRTDSPTNTMKFLQQQYPPKAKNAMEGLIKSLNTNFQIPKLSAKTAITDEISPKKKDLISNSTPVNTISLKQVANLTTIKNPRKDNKILDEKINLSILYSSNNIPTDIGLNKNIISDKRDEKNSIFKNKTFNLDIDKITEITESKIENQIDHDSDIKSTTDTKVKNNLVGAATSTSSTTTATTTITPIDCNNMNDKMFPINSLNSLRKLNLPSSPGALSMHILKSPVPSPTTVQSHQINSPHIDDDLMDEALVGMGSK